MPPTLQEQFYETDRARLQRWVPWLHLFRGFRLATRWQNLALALLGVLLLAAGRWVIAQLPFSSHQRQTVSTPYRPVLLWDSASSPHRPTIWPWSREFLSPPLPTVREVKQGERAPSPLTLLAPLGDFVRPAAGLFRRRNTWSDVADIWLNVLLVLGIGSFVGGAITRRVALEFGRSREPGLIESLRFGVSDFPFVFGAPLISVVGVGLLLLLGRIVGWIGLIPAVGEIAAALLWGLVLLAGLVLALILLGVAVAWPLMVAAHAAEGTDGFDALNRAYNYVFVRPWYSAWLMLVALAYGTVLLVFVLLLTGLVLHLGEWMIAGPMSDDALGRLTANAPELIRLGSESAEGSTGLAGRIAGVWSRGLASLLTAFVYSYFWASATLIYLLLRQSVDACELSRIYLPSDKPSPDGPPLVGMAAVERREAALGKADASAETSAEKPPADSGPEA